ncbi:MAG: manganese efflux pump MntP family protein [Bacteroidales bacterium]|nr:manganese efflux pump MntP family protein [Bacteroidales bacterium]
MNIVTIFLLAVSLAMDCFAVSCTAGLTQPKLSWRNILFFAFCFGFFQAMMPVIGYFLGVSVSQFISRYAPWIAFLILAFIGGKMIFEGVRDNGETMVDMTSLKSVLILSVATSIDALAVGFSFSLMENFPMVLAVVIIGVVSFAASIIGYQLTKHLGKRMKSNIAEIIGGIVLICIGLHILLG